MTFAQKELFGGAIVAELPADFLNASDFRQIPDHQEVYLSSTTLTSIVVELNEYVRASQITDGIPLLQASPPSLDNPCNTFNEDQRAVLYHVNDVLLPEPNSPRPSLSVPLPITLGNAELLEQTRAWRVNASVETPSARAKTTPRTKEEATTGVREIQYEHTTIYFLLIRISSHQTDICVQVNVPWKELVPRGRDTMGSSGETSAAAASEEISQPRSSGHEEKEALETARREEEWAEECLQRIVSTIEVRNWGLFGAE